MTALPVETVPARTRARQLDAALIPVGLVALGLGVLAMVILKSYPITQPGAQAALALPLLAILVLVLIRMEYEQRAFAQELKLYQVWARRRYGLQLNLEETRILFRLRETPGSGQKTGPCACGTLVLATYPAGITSMLDANNHLKLVDNARTEELPLV